MSASNTKSACNYVTKRKEEDRFCLDKIKDRQFSVCHTDHSINDRRSSVRTVLYFSKGNYERVVCDRYGSQHEGCSLTLIQNDITE